jgi:hypothetical protein
MGAMAEPVYLTALGETKPMTHWAKEFGINIGTLYNRLKNGWSVSEAILTPVGPSVGPRMWYIIYDKRTDEFLVQGTAEECAKALGLKVNTIQHLAHDCRRGRCNKYDVTAVKINELEDEE